MIDSILIFLLKWILFYKINFLYLKYDLCIDLEKFLRIEVL